MRKVSKVTAQAFKSAMPIKVGNSMVRVVDGGDALYYLHGNRIASMFEGKLNLTDCGWRTPTTKERLNSIMQVLGIDGHIHQSKGEWFMTLNGITSWWEGSTQIKL